MRSLGVKCKACGQVFGTGILVGVYGRPVFGPMALPCPGCGGRAAYRNEDLLVLPPPAARS